MEFENKPLDWSATGTEPPEELKQEGFKAGYKPPASYFNFFWNKTYVCIKELQEKIISFYQEFTEGIKSINTTLSKKANIDSPSLTGIPTAPTAEKGTKTDQIATTKFVDDIVSAIDFSPLQQHTKYVANANLNTLLDDQSYICAGTLSNAPVSTTYCIVRVYDTASTNNILQIVYVPQSDSTVRTFIRAINGGSVFGKWLELTTTKFVNDAVDKLTILIAENKFRSNALAFAMRKAILMLYIELFETTDDIDTSVGDGTSFISNYYNTDTHSFIKNDDTTKTIYTATKVVTIGNNYVWGYLDWIDLGNGSVKLYITRDNGTNYVEVGQDVLVSMSGKPTGVSMKAKLVITGKVRLLNFAWGCK